MIPEKVQNRETPAQQLVDSGTQISLLDDFPTELLSLAEERAGYGLSQLGEPGVDQFKMMRELVFAFLEYHYQPEKPNDRLTMKASGVGALSARELTGLIALDDDDDVENPTG